MITCPKCGASQAGGQECRACGVVFAAYERAKENRARTEAEAQDRFSTPLAMVVGDTGHLEVEQHWRSWWEILINWEQRNQYAIRDGLRQRGWVVEQGRTFLRVLTRQLLGSHRPLELAVLDPADELVLTLSRPFYWLFSSMRVEDGVGQPLGVIEKRWGLVTKKYDLRCKGRLFARISSGIWKIWTFPVLDAAGSREIAVISKKWGGLLKEAYTDADKFRIEFKDPRLTIEEKGVLLAAALSIDFDYFENNDRRR